jgi:tetratricopeptide (TPR) repeat protein
MSIMLGASTVRASGRAATRINLPFFSSLLVLLIAVAIIRSAIATRLDGFTIDEAYHIAAGVSYVRLGDFRINPEQPPLVKLWVGSFIAPTAFRASALRSFSDKQDERTFAEEDVYLHNDPDAVQRRAQIAMFTLNGLLFVALGFAARRAFGPGVALGTIAFLVIDPTVAAHLPVVMMDLPVSLLCACAVLLTIPAFRNWKWTDLAACSLALGLALAAKHSAPVFLVFVFLAGCFRAFVASTPGAQTSRRLSRFAMVMAVLLGALAVLWATYRFRYTESSASSEVFNRPLADKISDVRSPVYRAVLQGMRLAHIVPRAYIWGFADTIRAGLEGRITPINAFGHAYIDRGPKYYFPAMVALKLPIGLSILILIGLFACATRRAPPDASATVLAALALFTLVLISGSTYAGIRHALPVVALLAVVAGLGLQFTFSSNSAPWKVAAGAALAIAAASALPVMRPWEYFNEFIGSSRAYLYFSDEGVDLGQRVKELAAYYHSVVEPSGEVPFIFYGPISEVEERARGIDWLGRDPHRDQSRLESPTFSGTLIVDGRFLGKFPFWDNAALRRATPAVRFGNLLVFRGTCACGPILAGSLYQESLSIIFAAKPDWSTAQRLLEESVALDPSPFFVHIELGNVYLMEGRRDLALHSYSDALKYAPSDPQFRQPIRAQIQEVSSHAVGHIDQLRDPFLE